jgi:hypothetical protein
MKITAIIRSFLVGLTGLNESNIEINAKDPPYAFIDITANKPISKTNTATKPNPLNIESPTVLNAAIGLSVPSGDDDSAPSPKTQTPLSALGRYVHLNVEETPTSPGKYLE